MYIPDHNHKKKRTVCNADNIIRVDHQVTINLRTITKYLYCLPLVASSLLSYTFQCHYDCMNFLILSSSFSLSPAVKGYHQ